MNRDLARQLGVWSAGAVVVNSMIGSGIFRVPGAVAAGTGSASLMFLAWIIGVVVAVCGALSLAELAVLFPRAGGMYVYLHETYGRLPAFLFGWFTLVILPAGLAALGLVFAEYLSRLVPMPAGAVRLVAGAGVLLAVGLNYRSVPLGALLQRYSSAVKISAILLLTLAAVALPATSVAASTAPPLAPPSWAGFGLALVAVLFACNGWQDAAALAGETRDPARTMPRALIGGTVTVAAVYLAVNAGYLHVLGMRGMAASPLVAADTAVALVGRVGTGLIAALVAVSTLATLSAVTMTNPRVLYAMARDGLFFSRVGAVHPRYATPHVAVVTSATLALVYLGFRSFDQLIEIFILGNLPFWSLAVLGVPILRRRRPDLPRPYRVPASPVVPGVFVLAMLALIGNSLAAHPGSAGACLAALLAGVPAYWIWTRGLRNPR